MATAQASPLGSDVHCSVLGIPGVWAAKQMTFQRSGLKQPCVVLADSIPRVRSWDRAQWKRFLCFMASGDSEAGAWNHPEACALARLVVDADC